MSEKVHYLIKEETLQEIAQAVRNKTNETGEIVVSELADKINNIESGGGGSFVQSDWNQTDETAADFIKNKPFGDDVMEIVPLGDVEFVILEDEGLSIATIPCDIAIAQDNVLEVFWDGTTYTTKALDSGAVVFGNLGVFGLEDTGEPFTGLCLEGKIELLDLTVMEPVTRELSISLVIKNKVPIEYIPFAHTEFYCIFFENGAPLYLDRACTIKATQSDLFYAVNAGLISVLDTNYQVRYVAMMAVGNQDSSYVLVRHNDEIVYLYIES